MSYSYLPYIWRCCSITALNPSKTKDVFYWESRESFSWWCGYHNFTGIMISVVYLIINKVGCILPHLKLLHWLKMLSHVAILGNTTTERFSVTGWCLVYISPAYVSWFQGTKHGQDGLCSSMSATSQSCFSPGHLMSRKLAWKHRCSPWQSHEFKQNSDNVRPAALHYVWELHAGITCFLNVDHIYYFVFSPKVGLLIY